MNPTAQASALLHRARFYLDVPAVLRLLRFRQRRSAYYRELWRGAARAVGADFADWQDGFASISRDGLMTVVRSGEVMLDSHLMLELIGNKAMVYQLLAAKGCQVPRHCHYNMASLERAINFMNNEGGAVVVKPASGTGGGRGVTTGVADAAGLRKASRYAARFDSTLIAERQISGASYRLLYLDGRLIDAVRRDPPVLTGDGRRSIRQLVAAENAARLSGAVTALSPLTIDHDMRTRLRELGLKPSSRLAAGRTVAVKRAVNENASAQNHGVRAHVHPETAALGAQLVGDLGVTFAGVDVLCEDISRPLGADNGLIGEINTTPGIHHHYLVADPATAVPVAELVLDHMFASRTGTMRLAPEPGVAERAGHRFAAVAGGAS